MFPVCITDLATEKGAKLCRVELSTLTNTKTICALGHVLVQAPFHQKVYCQNNDDGDDDHVDDSTNGDDHSDAVSDDNVINTLGSCPCLQESPGWLLAHVTVAEL